MNDISATGSLFASSLSQNEVRTVLCFYPYVGHVLRGKTCTPEVSINQSSHTQLYLQCLRSLELFSNSSVQEIVSSHHAVLNSSIINCSIYFQIISPSFPWSSPRSLSGHILHIHLLYHPVICHFFHLRK